MDNPLSQHDDSNLVDVLIDITIFDRVPPKFNDERVKKYFLLWFRSRLHEDSVLWCCIYRLEENISMNCISFDLI